MRRFWSYLIPLFILFGVLAFQFQFPSQIESLRLAIFDIFQDIKPRVYQPTPVRIIDIDDETLEKFGQWPWPRTLVADLVTHLKEAGAKTIVFDAVFAEPDRTSPKTVLPSWVKHVSLEPILAQLGDLPDNDALLAETVAKTPVVLAFGLTLESNPAKPLLRCGFMERGGIRTDKSLNYETLDYIWPDFKGSILNLPDLEKSALGNGSFNMGSDRSNIIRRVPMLFKLNNTLCPGLSMEAMRVFLGDSTYKITLAGASGEISFGEKTGLVGIRIGKLDIPTDKHSRLWLYDTGYKSERFIPAWKILSGEIPSGSLDGSLLFIGASAIGIKDLRATPLNPRGAGVEIHAQLCEQMFLSEFLMRPDWAEGVEFTYLIVLGLLLIALLPATGAVLCALVAILASAFAIGFSWYAFTQWHFLLDPILPSIVVLLIYLVSSFLNFLRTEAERSRIRGAFSRYLSPDLVKKLAKDPSHLKLGGEIRTMTFLFSDIRNFTSIAETMNAQELTQFMNHYMTPMTNIILRHGGTIDKYIGDCIMAFWNAPIEDKNHAQNACLAALEMQSYLREWNETQQQETLKQGKVFHEVRIGIGLNTGEACVGNMGSEYRFDYTVLGDRVNLASRLEGASKNYGVTTILGPETAASMPELALLEVDLIRVKGKQKPVKIYSLVGGKDLAAQAVFNELRGEHNKMLEAYRNQQWEEALKALENCRKLKLQGVYSTTLYDLYESRIQTYQTNPPAPDWDGVTVATTK